MAQNLEQVLSQLGQQLQAKRNISYRFLRQDGNLSEPGKEVCSFLDQHGFTDLEILGFGSASIALKDRANPNLVIRVSPIFVRPQIPQMLQAIHKYEGETSCIKVEFLRNIAADFNKMETRGLGFAFQKECRLSGYRLDEDDGLSNLIKDLGVFTYTDKDGTIKSVAMVVDDSTFVDSSTTDKPPTCTANYPTLEMQWRENCKLVEADARLKKMVGELPKPPATKIIASPTIGRP